MPQRYTFLQNYDYQPYTSRSGTSSVPAVLASSLSPAIVVAAAVAALSASSPVPSLLATGLSDSFLSASSWSLLLRAELVPPAKRLRRFSSSSSNLLSSASRLRFFSSRTLPVEMTVQLWTMRALVIACGTFREVACGYFRAMLQSLEYTVCRRRYVYFNLQGAPEAP